ncbi:1-phosphatidylinositol-4-phosphate 5-kinase [Fistulifera solaris]|uniref:1-phosphatidylinositol-4-phosphate 5-kinase n=1 Tax=Fistulifera solaris TaxID=1519565 RepID=A0A1Z5KPX2_FISSO|nr:1-phosphatidylinositol-4-phosphate 5-kinase [Fistulifera solaris]|eukprot:GAX28360.1 1-phosphatidylinositol-4-phosphate 5-kinase [Fistulifera solaris]
MDDSLDGFDTRERGANDDTTSHKSGHSGQGPYQIIEYDINEGVTNNGIDVMVDIDPLHIDDDSPAAAALRANANVKVSTMGKAARAVHLQTVRKIVKRASLSSKNGVVRGKPPRLPPTVEGGIADYQSSPLDIIDESAEMTDENGTDAKEVTTATITAPVVAGTAEAGKKVLEQVDTHDLIKLLRWKRKRTDSKKVVKQKSYVRGKVIDGEHELYTLSIAVMIGVRTSITRTNTELNSGTGHRWVRPMDFKGDEKYEFRPKGGSLTPPHMLAHTFKFKDYAPVVFAYLRRMFGVNEFDFLLSVCGNANFIEFISNAKSGQFFFYSSDGKYMIKTMTNAESKFLRRILPDYFKHCAENPNTMITRFFGMYRVKLYHLRREMKFVIMNSVYHTDKFLQSFYDLKGSVTGRDAKPGQGVKKDNDLRRGLPGSAMSLNPQQRAAMREQLVRDTTFLTTMGIMDYSMLVGVHHVPLSHKKASTLATMGFRPAPLSNAAPNSNLEINNSHSDAGSPEIAEASADKPEIMDHAKLVDALASHSNDTYDSRKARSMSEVVGAFFDHHGLEEDDNSYLEDTESKLPDEPSSIEVQQKKQQTIEKLYWPFQRFFDLHGHRRVGPELCATCSQKPCICAPDRKLLEGYNIPQFVPPLSNRKDKGFEMDTTGLKLPLRFQGPQGEELYGGKIFYMGIIDILQEYNSRKVLETRYRSFTAHRSQASCVPPNEYAKRFVDFFDQYTKPMRDHEKGTNKSDASNKQSQAKQSAAK